MEKDIEKLKSILSSYPDFKLYIEYIEDRGYQDYLRWVLANKPEELLN